MPRDPDQQRDERRLVDVAPGQMLRAGVVIHLIAEDAVTHRGKQVEEQLGEGDVEHDRRAGGKAVLYGSSGLLRLSDRRVHRDLTGIMTAAPRYLHSTAPDLHE